MKTVAQLLKSKASGPISVRPEATVHDVARLLAEKNIGAVLVMDGDRLEGIVSERDLVRKVVCKGLPTSTRAGEVMTRQVVFVTTAQTNEDCMALMTDKRIRHLPVLDKDRVVGVLSIGDLVKDTISEQQFIISQLENYIHR